MVFSPEYGLEMTVLREAHVTNLHVCATPQNDVTIDYYASRMPCHEPWSLACLPALFGQGWCLALGFGGLPVPQCVWLVLHYFISSVSSAPLTENPLIISIMVSLLPFVYFVLVVRWLAEMVRDSLADTVTGYVLLKHR